MLRLLSLPRFVFARAGLLLGLILGAAVSHAMVGQPRFVEFNAETNHFPLVQRGAAAPIFVDAADHPGVLRVARDLQADVKRVTGVTATVDTVTPRGDAVVIIGSVDRSSLIADLARRGKLDVADLQGKWEASLVQVVEDPFPGVARALVIAGSDKRGTVYATYDVSEQAGVSPWYWWADVPVAPREQLFVRTGRFLTPEPTVRYRGIFINDEAPALTNWSTEKFGGFNHTFYGHVFELILRLRGNYLWPAMWGSAFNDDDPKNPILADEYGIVMGTSHHEPLMRAHDEWRRYGKGAWNYQKNPEVLQDFWRSGVRRVKDFEKIVSIGMRGDGDEAMSEDTNVALLESIVGDQRRILTEVTGRPAEQIPQLWALYKEVQTYYEHGMRVPDDVTLLWCDDNWGNIRRLPTPAERGRSGGAGVYYHFDYVGGPRNYKWLNTVPITKIWEQMHLAWRHDANRIWIVNVGDIKPMEFPIEFFLTLAWNPGAWSYDRLTEYARAWAAREFGSREADEVAALIQGYTRLNGRRKPEMLSPETFSLVNYREADRVLEEWRDLTARAERQFERLPPEARDAYFQLVLYPVKASAMVHEIHVSAGLNRLYVRQGRSEAGIQAARTRELFAAEGALSRAYHSLGGGRWNHMMSQVKLGYTYWQQPEIEAMPAVSEVRARAGSSLAVALEGSETAHPSYGARPAILPVLDALSRGTRWIEVFNRGQQPFAFTARASQPWVTLSTSGGTVSHQVRIEVGAEWDAVPDGASTAEIAIESAAGERVVVKLPVHKPESLAALRGHVETDRQVAIEAPHFTRAIGDPEVSWKVLKDFGRTVGGVTVFPVSAKERVPQGESPRLEYEVHLSSSGEVKVELHCAPSLDYQSGEGLRLAVSFDDAAPTVLKLDTWKTLQTWEQAVGEGVRKVVSTHALSQPGNHVLKIWMVTPGVVLQRVVIDAGGVRPSYLGPPESPLVRDGVLRAAP